MAKKDSDNIKGKLYNLEIPVEPEIWEKIEGSLRRRRLRRRLVYAWSSAAVLVAALLLGLQWQREANPVENGYVAQTVQIQQPQESAQQILPDSAILENPSVMEWQEEPATGVQADAFMESIPETVEILPKEENPVNRGDDGNKKVEDSNEDGNIKGDENVNYRAKAQYLPGAGTVYEPVEKRLGKRYSVALLTGVIPGSSAGIETSTIKASSAGAGSISHSYNVEQISDTKYSLPLNLGIQFQFAVKENLALGVGVGYTMLRSKYDCLINKKHFEVKQTVHYIGIPVNVYGLIAEKGGVSFYLNAGVVLEKGLRVVYDLKSYNQKEHSSASVSGVDFSVNAGLGVEYRPGKTVGLYFEPNLVYYTNSNVPRSIRADQPLQVKAELGCRFHF